MNKHSTCVSAFILFAFIVLMIIIFPAKSVFAFSGSGAGTVNDPFRITTCIQLQSMADDLDAHYKLESNIDCSDTVNWNTGKGFVPVGVNPTDPFTGSLNGAGRTISDLTINRANDIPDDYGAIDDESYVGLFGATENAAVDNVHIRSSKVKGYASVGGIIGLMDGGTLENSSFNVTTADNSCDPGHCVWARYGYYGGGLVGRLVGGTVSHSMTGGPVKGSGLVIGGLIGSMDAGTLMDSSSTSNTDGGVDIGGVVGNMYSGTITRVSASGNARAEVSESSGKSGRSVGGFIGTMYGGEITDSYATGTSTADYGPAGGFIGLLTDGSVSRSYSSGAATVNVVDNGKQFSAGGFVGTTYGDDINDSFTVSDISTLNPDTGGFLAYDFTDPTLNNNHYDLTRTGKTFCYAREAPGSGNAEFTFPIGVAVDSSDNLYVVDQNNSRVQKFDSAGAYVSQWGTSGSGNGQFSSPYFIAVDSSDNVFVTDSGNYRVQKFDSAGAYVSQWGTYGTGNGQFSGPTGLAVDSSDNVYVVDNGGYRVQKFDSAGAYVSQWGTSGSGNGQFNNPYGVAVDSSGNVFIADSGNARVQKFDSAGAYVSQWGTYGTGNGNLISPVAISFDSSGNVFIADSGNARVQKFDSAGAYVSQWGIYGTGNGEFSNPYGLAIDSSNNVFVTDSGNHRIQKFDSSGAYASKWGGLTYGNTGCTAVNSSNSDPGYFYNPAHEPFAGSWDQNIWNFSGTSYPTLDAVDQDEDGIPSNIENAVSNGGDGNNDGVLDSAQSNVTSWLNTTTGEYTTLVAPAGTTVTSATNSSAISDGDLSYPFGLVGFTITGVTPGGTVSMTLIYHDNNTSAATLTARKYFPATQTFQNIPNASISNNTVGGENIVTLTYSLTDGGSLDLDGVANGSITDPVGLATSPTIIPAPTETVIPAITGRLAATGSNMYFVIFVVYMLIGLSFIYGLIFVTRKFRTEDQFDLDK